MLIYFPRLLPDELFYSACSRYHKIIGEGADLITSRDIFGEDITVFPWDLPDRLNLFVGNLPVQGSLDAKYILEGHTLYPFYRPFLTKEKAEKVVSVMYEKQTKNKKNRTMVGACGSNLPLVEFLRCCPRCMEEDEKKYGVSYWHRSHQVHGVFVCHRHKISLWKTRARTSHMSGISMFLPLEKALKDKPMVDSSLTTSEFEHLFWFADSVAWLLNSNLAPMGRDELCKRYESFLLRNDALTRNGKIWIKKVKENIELSLGEKLLSLLRCPLGKSTEKTWVYQLFRCQGFGPNPLYHLVLIHSLGLALKEFFSGKMKDEGLDSPQSGPFGDGPWPCLNPASDHYQANVVTECPVAIRNNDDTPVGTFSCKECGFIYRRSSPDKSNEDRFKRDRIVSFGRIFEDKLMELYGSQKLSLREIGRILKIDKSVVAKKIKRIEARPSMEARSNRCTVKKEVRRKEWIKFLTKKPGPTRNDVYKKQRGKISWFYRNDRVWFQSHLPPIEIGSASRVDWNARDVKYEKRIKEAVVKIREMKGPLVRVSVARIGQVSGIGKILYKVECLEKMPKTKKLLHSVVERVEQFQIRKLHFFGEYLRGNGMLCRTNLIQRSTIEPSRCNLRIKNEINRITRADTTG